MCVCECVCVCVYYIYTYRANPTLSLVFPFFSRWRFLSVTLTRFLSLYTTQCETRQQRSLPIFCVSEITWMHFFFFNHWLFSFVTLTPFLS